MDAHHEIKKAEGEVACCETCLVDPFGYVRTHKLAWVLDRGYAYFREFHFHALRWIRARRGRDPNTNEDSTDEKVTSNEEEDSTDEKVISNEEEDSTDEKVTSNEEEDLTDGIVT